MLILFGRMAAGKTTTMNILNEMGVPKGVTDTTRAKREGERDGIDYNFVTEEQFTENLRNNLYAEHTAYSATFGNVQYGSRKEIYETAGVIVLNPRGLRTIREKGIDATAVYLNISEKEMRKRLAVRGDSEDEINRRIIDDEPDFEDAFEIADYIIDVDGKTPAEVANAVLSIEDTGLTFNKMNEKKRYRTRIKRTKKKEREKAAASEYSSNPAFIKTYDGEKRNFKHRSEQSKFLKKSANRKTRYVSLSYEEGYDDEAGVKVGGNKGQHRKNFEIEYWL